MRRRQRLTWLLMCLPVLWLAGCVTYDPTRDERVSDLPWNEQQPWEGSIAVPGINQ